MPYSYDEIKALPEGPMKSAALAQYYKTASAPAAPPGLDSPIDEGAVSPAGQPPPRQVSPLEKKWSADFSARNPSGAQTSPLLGAPVAPPRAPAAPPMTLEEKMLAAQGKAPAPPPDVASPAQSSGERSGPIAGTKGLMDLSKQAGALPKMDIEGIKGRLGAAQAEQNKGLEMRTAAEEKLGAATADIQQAEIDQAKLEAERYKKIQTESQAAADAKRQEMTDLAADIAAKSPSRKNPYSEAGGGKGIALILMSAIAGASAGFRGKENQTLEIINGNIERDYQQQKDKQEGKKGNLATQNALYRDLKDKIKDERELHLAYGIAAHQDAGLRLAKAATTANSEQARGKYFEAMGLNAQAQEMKLVQLAAMKNDETMRSLQLQATIGSTQEHVKWGPPPMSDKMAMRREDEAQRAMPGYHTKGAPSKEDYEQAKPIYESLERGQRLFSRLMEMSKEGYKMTPERLSDFQTTRAALTREIQNIRKSPGGENMGAALSEYEVKLMNIPDTNSFRAVVPQLRVAQESMLEKGVMGLELRKFYRDTPFQEIP